MKIVCGWCQCEIDPGTGQPGVSHGICDDCAAFFESNRGVGIREFINRIGAPVMILDQDIRVEAANLSAGSHAQLSLRDIEGLLVGDVMECAHARSPGGCGKEAVCVMGCALRRIILETFATGKPLESIEARQQIVTGQGPREMKFWFSTALAGDRVLLRIDRVQLIGVEADSP